jgi:prevent-host-death family protein
MVMKQVAISEFKAKCLALLDEVQKTKQPILITRRGKPVAEVNPPKPTESRDWIGSMKGMSKILGDIISPASDPDDWEVLRD